MKIKVCGITSFEQLQELQVMGIAYAGLIFYEGSKRYAKEKLGSHKEAIRDSSIYKVGVFVNEKLETILENIAAFGLKAVQLHGDESPEFCEALMHYTPVIKVFRVKDGDNIDALVLPFQNAAHYFLFDTDTAGYGGSGQQFNWQAIREATINKEFFLSGGIGLEDMDKIKSFQHPFFYGVDVNSRFETAPGCKDMKSVQKFKLEVSAHNSAQ